MLLTTGAKWALLVLGPSYASSSGLALKLLLLPLLEGAWLLPVEYGAGLILYHRTKPVSHKHEKAALSTKSLKLAFLR